MTRGGRQRQYRTLATFLAGALAISAVGAHREPAGPPSLSAMIRAEAALLDAERSDQQPLASLPLAADYIEVDRVGLVRPRDESLRKPRRVVDVVDLHARIVGDVGVVLGRARLSPTDAYERFVRVWVQSDDRWTAVLRHATAMTEIPGAGSALPTLLAAPAAEQVGDAEASLLQAQGALENALETHDVAAFARLTAPEFIAVTARGAMLSKRARVAQERARRQLLRQRRSPAGRTETRARVYGTVGLITARATPAPEPPAGKAAPLRFSRVWLQRGGRWQQVFSITTEIKSEIRRTTS